MKVVTRVDTAAAFVQGYLIKCRVKLFRLR